MCSDEPELVCVYGRRRIGKTFFVNELMQDYYAFDASGLAEGGEASQLNAFHAALTDYGDTAKAAPADWWEAFRRLRALLERAECPRTPEGKRVVFLDEFPWFDTPRSGFMGAFSDFWNRWAQRHTDVKVVICGSATSWILREVLKTEGSLNRRVTHSLFLSAFTLGEVEEFLRVEKRLDWARREIIECYMVFGGVPYYLRKIQPRLSLSQNITSLCLAPQAPLRDEARILLDSTLSNRPVYYKVLSVLGEKKTGLSRKELLEAVGVKDGQGFTAVLMGLEECGYIRKYENPYRKGRKAMYQLIDPFLLFSMRFVGGDKFVSDWATYYDTPSYNAWRGNAFEIACLCHLPQIKRSLSLSTMSTRDFPWRSSASKRGAQVDLVIERPDRITYLCEMKFTNAPFSLSAAAVEELERKREVFKVETGTKHSVQTVLVSAAGVKGRVDEIVSQTVSGDDLFV
ncbi:MAG: AAA family ATPase [Eggerthellaceae bacterium]|nr:AAA family ATPase [Eggerthellaceae bacterium]